MPAFSASHTLYAPCATSKPGKLGVVEEGALADLLLVDGGGMAGGGSGCPGDGAENAIRLWRGKKVTALRFEWPRGRSCSLGRGRRCPPAPGREALLEGPVLGLSGAIDEKPADQSGA